MHVHAEAEDIKYPLSPLPTFPLETGSPTEAGARLVASEHQGLCFHLPPNTDRCYRLPWMVPVPNVGAADPYPGPCACTQSTVTC